MEGGIPPPLPFKYLIHVLPSGQTMCEGCMSPTTHASWGSTTYMNYSAIRTLRNCAITRGKQSECPPLLVSRHNTGNLLLEPWRCKVLSAWIIEISLEVTYVLSNCYILSYVLILYCPVRFIDQCAHLFFKIKYLLFNKQWWALTTEKM